MFYFFFRIFTYFYNFKKLFYIPYVEKIVTTLKQPYGFQVKGNS